MLDKWHKKEKPVFTGIVRGIGGFGFGIPSAGASGPTAYTQNSGGSISNYEDGGTHYRAHIFTSPGELVIDDPDLIGQNLEYLIIAGGGGGGARHGGGGGAGGMYVSPGFPGVPTSENQGGNLTVPGPGIIGVTVGKGGDRGTGPSVWTDSNKTTGYQGSPTYFGPPGGKLVEVIGGGGGGGYPHPNSAHPRMPGGAGGGGGNMPGTQSGGVGNFPGATGARMGHPGGAGGPAPSHYTGGGGGAGGSGVTAVPGQTGPGGLGRQVWIAEPSSTPAVQASVGAPGPSGFTGSYFAGGGGGGGENYGTGINGGGDGGQSSGDTFGRPGLPSTGGGGGGARTPSVAGGGRGGSGIAIVRYQIPGSQGTAKASGGVVSFYNNKTIHTFHGPGRFVTATAITDCEIVIIGGGGGGGMTYYTGSYSDGSGGGGAGAFIKKSGVTISSPSDIVIGKGGTGATAFQAKNTNLNHNGSGSPTSIAYRGEDGWATTAFGYTAVGGGGGANGGESQALDGQSGGSGGGAARHPGVGGGTTVDQFYPGPKDSSADTPNSGWGHPGGATGQPGQRAGGGGGAGRNGWDATNSQVRSWTPQAQGDTKGCGGAGMQLPATFRDPNCRIGARGPTNVSNDNPGVSGLDNSGYYWVCGGGGGGADFSTGSGGQGDKSPGGGEGPGVNPWSGGGCGGGQGGDPIMGAGTYPGAGGNAYENTGGGGGGSSGAVTPNSSSGGSGGSGLVLVAYPT